MTKKITNYGKMRILFQQQALLLDKLNMSEMQSIPHLIRYSLELSIKWHLLNSNSRTNDNQINSKILIEQVRILRIKVISKLH